MKNREVISKLAKIQRCPKADVDFEPAGRGEGGGQSGRWTRDSALMSMMDRLMRSQEGRNW